MNKTALETADLFQVSRETIRKWVIEFEEHFTDSVRVPPGQQRMFSPEDLEIVGLIAAFKAEGKRFSDIHKALRAGERGSIPVQSAALATAPDEKQLALMARVEQLEIELETLRDAESQNRLLKQQLADAQAEIKALNREIGRLEASKDSE